MLTNTHMNIDGNRSLPFALFSDGSREGDPGGGSAGGGKKPSKKAPAKKAAVKAPKKGKRK